MFIRTLANMPSPQRMSAIYHIFTTFFFVVLMVASIISDDASMSLRVLLAYLVAWIVWLAIVAIYQLWNWE
jgi:glucan phosphoethanolaminetransferase (alkaline phosphatase superfamily)